MVAAAAAVQLAAGYCLLHVGRPDTCDRLGGYTACGIPFVRLTNGNGNGNGIPLNGIPFNRIPFPFVFVKKIFESSVSVHFR